MDLRLTHRALTDLGLDLDVCRGRSARDLIDHHEVIRSFVALAARLGAGQRLRPPVTWARVSPLDIGDWFGLVWVDEESGVTWLLGAIRRSQGEEPQHLLHRDQDNELFPTLADYQDLEPSSEQTHRFAVEAAGVGARVIETLEADPSTPLEVEIGGLHLTVSVDTVSDPQIHDIKVAVQPSLSDPERDPPHPGSLLLLVGAILPEAQYSDLSFQGGTPIIITWRRRSQSSHGPHGQ